MISPWVFLTYLYLIIISGVFLYINYKILYSDVKKQIIPNKQLLYLLILLPFTWWYILLNFDINIIYFVIQIIVSFLISFILYSLSIWSAGDAKYLLILACYIPHIWIVPLIWNIALVTIIYLLLYYLWFYLVLLLNPKKFLSLFQNIYIDLRDKFLFKHLKKWEKNEVVLKKTLYSIVKFTVLFLLIFVIIRITRIAIIGKLYSQDSIKSIIESYHIYLVLLIIAVIFGSIWIARFLMKFVFNYITQKFKIKNMERYTWWMIITLFTLLGGYVSYEYMHSGPKILKLLSVILTIYLWISLFFRSLFYSYKIVFNLCESYYKKIDDLAVWDIISKEYLLRLYEHPPLELVGKNNWLFTPTPVKFFKYMPSQIDSDTLELLQKLYREIDKYYKKIKAPGYKQHTTIQLVNAFPFSPYILIWFVLTVFVWNYIFQTFLSMWFDFIVSIYS